MSEKVFAGSSPELDGRSQILHQIPDFADGVQILWFPRFSVRYFNPATVKIIIPPSLEPFAECLPVSGVVFGNAETVR